ncbi:hypothetical protein RYD26_12570 [Pasteurellaceae bacterium LIM206]|nr:hypothetical protein [Pasteurellaceae bacterium LIM206]
MDKLSICSRLNDLLVTAKDLDIELEVLSKEDSRKYIEKYLVYINQLEHGGMFKSAWRQI